MTRRPITKKQLAELWTIRHKHDGIAELQIGKGFTREEEDEQVMKAFKEITNDFGYPHIHTLKVVPEDGRPPYYVYVDNLERK